MKPIFKSRVLVISLILAFAGCGAGRDYTVEELGVTLSELGLCDNEELEVSVRSFGSSTVAHADCMSESFPGGLLVTTFPSSQVRLLYFVGLVGFGCDDLDKSAHYAFGDKWIVITSQGLIEVPDLEDTMQRIAKATGGYSNTISCSDLLERFEPFEGQELDDMEDAERAEINRAVLGEPGSDPSLLDPPSG